jgi:hypothetical protein
MELHPDVVVYSLKILVDPADGSYTPSLLIVSMGDSLSSLKETAVVAVGLQVSVPEYFLELHSKFVYRTSSYGKSVHGTGYLAEPYITAASAAAVPVPGDRHQTMP